MRLRTIGSVARRRIERIENATIAVGQPTEIDHQDEEERLEDCEHYRDCLQYASDLLWTAFSCRRCPDFEASDAEVQVAAEDIRASLTNALRSY